jgi:lipid-binding SYLF domain-containing protein
MKKILFAVVALLGLVGETSAQSREAATVTESAAVLESLAAIPLRGIPPALMQDAQGIAVVPGVVKAGFVLGGRFGRGVVLLREADGGWSNPVFVTMTGGSIGWQIGVQSTDVVLVFKNRASLERIIQGKHKLTLGADAAVAAGPVGRQAEAGTDGQLKAEIYSYSRSRGLFAGVSFEGAGILADTRANEAYYRVAGGQPAAILAARNLPLPAEVLRLKNELSRITPVMQPPIWLVPGTPADNNTPLPPPTPIPIPPPPK